jgi:hypothetical protein
VERQFDVVVVESFDRVARSQSELPQVWEMLRFCGCELMAVDDGRASEISIGVRGLVGALYLTDLASKTRRGLAGKLAQGQRAGGLPYGFRPIVGRPGEHEIDRDQAAVVLRIFRDYAGGYTCREIAAAALNREGVKPFRGRAWNASTIHGSAKRIVVVPRVKPGDPIHFEVRGRLAALMQPDQAKCRWERWCPGAGSNHRHCDFQSHALPTELPGQVPA